MIEEDDCSNMGAKGERNAGILVHSWKHFLIRGSISYEWQIFVEKGNMEYEHMVKGQGNFAGNFTSRVDAHVSFPALLAICLDQE